MLFKNNKQAGVSLVEVMVSMAVSLLVLAGVIQIYLTANLNAKTVNGSSAIQERVRFLFSNIESDVSRAGYAGCLNFNVATNRVQNIIKNNSAPVFNEKQFIAGVNDVSLSGKTFDEFTVSLAGSEGRAAIKKVNSNSFVVDPAASERFVQGDIAVVGDCSSFGIFRVTNAPLKTGIVEFATTGNTGPFAIDFLDENTTTPTITYLYSGSGAFRYYVDTSVAGQTAAVNCSASHLEYCALFRQSTSTGDVEELFDGVGAFEVEYGWKDAATGNLFFANASSVPANRWHEIDRLKVSATIRSPEKAATNNGMNYIERQFTRQFFFFNQAPEA